MHRNKLKKLLLEYDSVYSEENKYQERMINFMNNHKNCFERHCVTGHFTASCWLIDKSNNRALLTHHAKLDDWFQLGGHCDGESDPLAVAIKEAREESGINNIKALSDKIFDIDIHLIPEINNEPTHYHYDVRFILKVCSDEPLVINRESKALKWFGKDEQLPTGSLSVTRMFDKWLEF